MRGIGSFFIECHGEEVPSVGIFLLRRVAVVASFRDQEG